VGNQAALTVEPVLGSRLVTFTTDLCFETSTYAVLKS